MASELKPCPFCGSNFKIGREPQDNDPVAGMFYIFHEYGPIGSEARKCKLDIQCHFNAEEEAVAFWNTRHAPVDANPLTSNPVDDKIAPDTNGNADELPSDGSCVRCGSVPRNASGLCNTCLDEDAERLENTRPAPAATDTGLVTIGYGYMNSLGELEYAHTTSSEMRTEALCRRSQAAELLAALTEEHDKWMSAAIARWKRIKHLEADNAAKDAIIERHREAQVILGKQLDEVIADNAAKAARIKELEADVKREAQSSTHNAQDCLDEQLRAEALEAKLAAAETFIKLCADGAFVNDPRLRGAARAVLGGKPS